MSIFKKIAALLGLISTILLVIPGSPGKAIVDKAVDVLTSLSA